MQAVLKKTLMILVIGLKATRDDNFWHFTQSLYFWLLSRKEIVGVLLGFVSVLHWSKGQHKGEPCLGGEEKRVSDLPGSERSWTQFCHLLADELDPQPRFEVWCQSALSYPICVGLALSCAWSSGNWFWFIAHQLCPLIPLIPSLSHVPQPRQEPCLQMPTGARHAERVLLSSPNTRKNCLWFYSRGSGPWNLGAWTLVHPRNLLDLVLDREG